MRCGVFVPCVVQFNVGSSAAIHKMFVDGCTCNELEFKRLADTKLHAIVSALRRSVNASLPLAALIVTGRLAIAR